MSALFAAGPFDQPWLVAVFIIVGLLSNWLMKRRQEKEAGQQPEAKPPTGPDQPQGEFDLETAMRRLLGEMAPPQQPVPPPIPAGAAPVKPTPEADWQAEEFVAATPRWKAEATEDQAAPLKTKRPSPTPVRSPAVTVGEDVTQAARRLAELDAIAGRPVAAGPGGSRSLRRNARAAYWRDSRNARQAFVASLVFGPPKGLES